MRKALVFLCSACVLASCAAPKASTLDLENFAEVYENTFETSPDSGDGFVRDQRVRVRAEGLPGVWFYNQLNTGDTRKLYRQRVSHITTDTARDVLLQATYTLNDPAALENAWENPAVLTALTRDDINPLFNVGCELTWKQKSSETWRGYVDPKSCVIDSKRRNKKIRIESESELSTDLYRTSERGYDIDMNYVWGSSPGEMISLYPVQP